MQMVQTAYCYCIACRAQLVRSIQIAELCLELSYMQYFHETILPEVFKKEILVNNISFSYMCSV